MRSLLRRNNLYPAAEQKLPVKARTSLIQLLNGTKPFLITDPTTNFKVHFSRPDPKSKTDPLAYVNNKAYRI
jgi:hypothetical protein